MPDRHTATPPAAPLAAPLAATPARPGRMLNSILDTVGHTPLVRLPRLEAARGLQARLALKLEFFNPLASLKDRIGAAMVADAEAAGLLTPGATPPQTIVEPTSGNTGIALAFVAAARGYRLVVTMPDGASAERRKMLRLLGAEVVLTPAPQGMAGAIAEAERILGHTPGAWMPRQFNNPANPAIHAHTTAEELWADTEGQLDLVVAGLGTGGTLTGIATALKPRKPGLTLVGVEPAESAVLSGDDPGPHEIQGIGAGFKPAVLQLDQIDLLRRVTERDAFNAARLCARTDGIPIGISSGAVLHAMLDLAQQPEHRNTLIVGIAASFAERYLSTELFHGM
jgi:cysteine synthase